MNGYERVEKDEKYFYEDATGTIHADFEDADDFNNDLFAEKLKMECYATYDEVLPSLFADVIDNVVKEMTEVNNE